MRIELTGCGFFALEHVTAWDDISNAELVAICDLNSERSKFAENLFFIVINSEWPISNCSVAASHVLRV